jgi:23S rRNA pseudouridine2605 synthase
MSGPPPSPEAGAVLEPGTVERLQRTLARAGYGSRRSAEGLIAEGRVTVGGRVAELGDRVDPSRASIAVDGVPIPANPELRYFAFNKPQGVTSTLADRHAARSLAEFIPAGPRVFPVGRLDRDSEGLLLLTNDGALANRLQHPRYGVEKEYLVEVDGAFSRSAAGKLQRGVRLEDGVARPIRVEPVQQASARSALTVVMAEGRKREVRRMLEAVGHPVRRLIRVRQGPVHLGRLAPGNTRALTSQEIAELYRTTGLERAAVGQRRPGPQGRARPGGSKKPRPAAGKPRSGA